MDLAVFQPSELPFALRALHDVVASNRSVTAAERRFLEVVAELHGAEPAQVAALEAVAAGEVAQRIAAPHARKRLVQLAVIAAMVEGEVGDAAADAVQRLARALRVEEKSLKVLHRIAAEHRLWTRFDMMRRIMGGIGSRAYAEEGLAGLRKMSALFTGGREDAEVAWKYRSLGLLPRETLGRVFWEHCTVRRFAFPGETGGIPERLVFHDFGHVLSGYDTDPQGEIQQGAFQGGFIREDGFAFLMFAVIQFHLGIQITPVADAQTGLFDAGLVLRAAQRGAACTVDLSDGWDPFAVAHLPLAELREAYGIPPL
jgi:hypothetical protein